MKKAGKILSLLLALAMVFSLACTVTVGAEGAVKILVEEKSYSRAEGQTMEAYLASLVTEGIISDIASGTEYPEDGSALFPAAGEGSTSAQKTAFKLVSKLGYRYDVEVKVKSKSGTLGESGKQYVRFESGAKYYFDNHTAGTTGSENYVNTGRADLILDEATGWYDLGKAFTAYYGLKENDDKELIENTSITECIINFKEVQPSGSTPIGFYAKDLVIKETLYKTFSGLAVSAGNDELNTNETAQLTVTGTVSGTTDTEDLTESSYVTYKSDAEGVAKVDSNGKVTAVGKGSANITATLENGENSISSSVQIIVKDAEQTVIKIPEENVLISGSKTIKELMDGNFLNPSFTLSEENYTSDGGYYVGVANATGRFRTASVFEPGYSYKISANVKSAGSETAVMIASDAINITGPDSVNASYLSQRATTDSSVWVLLSKDIAYYGVISSGANVEKNTELWFIENRYFYDDGEDGKKYQGYHIKNISVIQYDPAKTVFIGGLSVAADDNDLTAGDTAQLTVTGSVYGTSETRDLTESSYVTYTSDAEGVATVDAYGKITAVGAGSANITATLTNGGESVSTTALITVAAPTPVFSAATIDSVGAYTYNEKEYANCIYVYGKVSNAADIAKAGFTFTSNVDAYSNLNDYDMTAGSVTADGAFAVRLVADTLESGTYSFVPYCVTGGETIIGDTLTHTK